MISIGDFNLNHCNWTDPNVPFSSQTYKLRLLISALFTRILPFGVCQLVKGPTRFSPGKQPSGLDHFFTSNPDKIALVEKHHYGGSDHMLILVTRTAKSIKSSPGYIRKGATRILMKVNSLQLSKG